MNKQIIDILQPLGVPVGFLKYNGTETTYITFFFYNEYGVLRADDQEVKTNYSLQVDVFSKGNYKTLVNQVKQALKNIGYERTFATDLYEDDTKFYHKVLRFKITSEVE